MVIAAFTGDVIFTIFAADMIGGARNVLRHGSIASVAPALVDTQAASIRNECDKFANEELIAILF